MGSGARGGTVYAVICVVTIIGLLIFARFYRLLASAAKKSEIEESVVGKEFIVVSTMDNIVRGTVRFRGSDVEFLAHAPHDETSIAPGDKFTVLSDVRPYITITRIDECLKKTLSLFEKKDYGHYGSYFTSTPFLLR
ncbi:NfeD family protein [Arcanobacterium buesumense]|uniref:NfeD-like C-terminal domain-containing protein n=1 Tax=Arcanobacterium buesumense TaxID=2722751 RepID=A0A6H2ENB1_9ACTO|nr:NfeD family protein [Arcanobacterium buesumense]QJC22563.1 hypothetical protein HC352_08665 [Arcanobacterium buesumense]